MTPSLILRNDRDFSISLKYGELDLVHAFDALV
ncbi:hypothetical protein PF66_02341 [Pseudomonas asplenii]|uniref:Uncharacterized protein n=1 Tax=Pseudomonas asplenii TaxID=53407 RepID=A0A0N1J624_9PSED|nr:hypothetical protein PF66_02341 [Pseudomonas fuscovaginae]